MRVSISAKCENERISEFQDVKVILSPVKEHIR